MKTRCGTFPRTNSTTTAHQAAAFTLIEVLVVVATIALLLAILLPSLNRARDAARQSVCAANMKQAANGAIFRLLENRKERWSANFGWAAQSLKTNQWQSDIFTCPTDNDPRPVPALSAQLFSNDAMTDYRGTTSADAIFNHVFRVDQSRWQTDIQSVVDGDWFGADASSNDIDLLLEYSVSADQKSASVTVKDKEAAWNFRVEDHRGRVVWSNAGPGVPAVTVPLLWMSYGINASSGLKNVKGNPAFLIESGTPGVFPEDLVRDGRVVRGADRLPKVLRFRHGGKSSNPILAGYDYTTRESPGADHDVRYRPRERANVGFLDGHVEAMSYWQLFDPDARPPKPRYSIWFGGRRGTELSY